MANRLFTYDLTPTEIVSTYNPDQIRGQITQNLFGSLPAFGGGPMGGSNMGGAAIGMGLGYGLAGLMGKQPPAVQRLQNIQQIGQDLMSQMNISDQISPEEQRDFIGKFGTKLIKEGYTDEGFKIMSMAGPRTVDEPITAKDIAPISKEVTPVIKGATAKREAASALDDLKEGSSATDKVAAVFKFMKALDPTSTVRETEQGQVYSAKGPMAEFAGWVNSLSGGGRLDDDIFRQIVTTSKRLANSEIDSASVALEGMLGGYAGTRLDKKGYLDKQRARLPEKFTIEESPAKPKGNYGDLNNDEISELERLRKKYKSGR